MSENDLALIDVLPDEVIEYVFQFLDIIDIKINVAAVCKRWYRVSKSYSLLKQLTFGPNMSTETAIQVLRQAPLLSHLELLSRTDANNLLNEVSFSNHKIVKLKISANKDARYTEVDSEVLINCVHSLRVLKYLTLKRVSFDRPEYVCEALGPSVSKLKSLNLNHSIQLDTNALSALVNGLPELSDFRIYCISFNRIGSVTPYTDAPVVELARKMMDTLQVLKLNMLGITGAAFQALSSLPHLRVLHLYRMVMVQDESIHLLARLQRLEKLMVTIPRTISSSCWCQLLGSASMANLTMIVISNSYTVDDTVLGTIAENCPAMEELGFPGCRGITHMGVIAVIERCHRLTKINLFSTKHVISEAFRLLPTCLPRLQLLIFRAVDRTETSFPEEVSAMPNLQLRTVYRYP